MALNGKSIIAALAANAPTFTAMSPGTWEFTVTARGFDSIRGSISVHKTDDQAVWDGESAPKIMVVAQAGKRNYRIEAGVTNRWTHASGEAFDAFLEVLKFLEGTRVYESNRAVRG